MENKKTNKIKLINKEVGYKNLLSSNTLFFLTDEQKKQIKGGQEEETYCRRSFSVIGGVTDCKCGYRP
jgi:hypothetical protein